MTLTKPVNYLVLLLRKAEARKQYKGKKYLPLDLRPKKTRKIRRALKTEQKYAKTPRQLLFVGLLVVC